MKQLGDDVLLFIFNKINFKNHRNSFSQVSKQFLRVSCIRLIKLRILYPNRMFPDMMYDILPMSQNLVSFRCYKPLSNTDMKLLTHSCPKLKNLNLCSFTKSESDFDDGGLCVVANACSYLVQVDLTNRLHVGDVGVDTLLRSCKNLTSLDLSRCVNVTDESLRVIGETTTRLAHLYLTGCYLITDLGLKFLENTNLVHLNLAECDKISDVGIIYLKRMINLSLLNISGCGVNVTNTGIVAVLPQLPNIWSLDLSYLINVTDVSLFVIASKCLKLFWIKLNGCKAVTSEGLRAFDRHTSYGTQNSCSYLVYVGLG